MMKFADFIIFVLLFATAGLFLLFAHDENMIDFMWKAILGLCGVAVIYMLLKSVKWKK
jgi:hypothetical protein